MVLVSTHSANSIWKLAMSSDLRRRVSDQPVVSTLSGVLYPPRKDFDIMVMEAGLKLGPSWWEVEGLVVRVEAEAALAFESRGSKRPSMASSSYSISVEG